MPRQFCARHQLPAWDSRLVITWLVQNHLVMSTTAQRKDLSDPQVIFDFAQQVGDQTRLDYLYVLTVADINATNPSLWNSWRASLLRQLYTETKRALRRGLENPLDREEQIRQTQSRGDSTSWCVAASTRTTPSNCGRQLGDDYFLRHTASRRGLAHRGHPPAPGRQGPTGADQARPPSASSRAPPRSSSTPPTSTTSSP